MEGMSRGLLLRLPRHRLEQFARHALHGRAVAIQFDRRDQAMAELGKFLLGLERHRAVAQALAERLDDEDGDGPDPEDDLRGEKEPAKSARSEEHTSELQ